MYAQSEIAEQVFEAIQNGGSWSGEVELKTKNGGIVHSAAFRLHRGRLR